MNKNQKSTNYQLMKEGKPYQLDDFLISMQKQCATTLNKVNRLPFTSNRRHKLMSKLFGGVGDNNIIKSGLNCNYGFNITIGNGCYINYGVTIIDSFEVEIGDNVFIAPHVAICSVTHPNEYKDRRQMIGGKVTISDNAWIGAGAIIFPGVTIGAGAIVGAGAVVRQDVKPNTIVAGVPAKVIKTIEQ